MLQFCSLYSGSSGNSLLVKNNNTNILIDAGVSMKKIITALSSININITNIDAILVTHEHSDHIKSIGNISKKYNIPIYANKETWSAMPQEKEKVSEENQRNFKISQAFSIGNLEIYPFKTSHDAINSCGFNIFNEKQKLSIATDLGYVDDNIMRQLENSSFVLLESNYDPEILKYCSYPYMLKNRISSSKGHLSNYDAGQVISKLINSGLKSAMLGHLSKESNFPELAYKTVLEQLHLNNYNEHTIDLNVASRFEPSKLIEIC